MSLNLGISDNIIDSEIESERFDLQRYSQVGHKIR
jgi:hypothetical protein